MNYNLLGHTEHTLSITCVKHRRGCTIWDSLLPPKEGITSLTPSGFKKAEPPTQSYTTSTWKAGFELSAHYAIAFLRIVFIIVYVHVHNWGHAMTCMCRTGETVGWFFQLYMDSED